MNEPLFTLNEQIEDARRDAERADARLSAAIQYRDHARSSDSGTLNQAERAVANREQRVMEADRKLADLLDQAARLDVCRVRDCGRVIARGARFEQAGLCDLCFAAATAEPTPYTPPHLLNQLPPVSIGPI